MFSPFRRLGLVCLATVSFAGLALRAAESAPPSPAAILQQLRSFNTTGTVLHVAAHPDDENTQLITYLARGRGYRAAYLSLTRGDGGQNELGRDFDEKLGVARTQELIAARKLDGGRQFFTRAIDFGFSKSPEETLAFWNRDQVLADVVRVIRTFRPDVIVTRFPIPPGSGGHGHHTASGMLAVEAFKLAGDPAAYPEQLTQGLTVWQPTRVVWNGFGGNRGGGLTGPTVTMDIGGEDPVNGQSFGTIANESRGMHKTQGLGGFSGRAASGPNVQTFLHFGGTVAEKDLMDGVDTTWNRIPGGAEIAKLTDDAIAKFNPQKPSASVPALLEIRTKLAALTTDPLVADKRTQLDRIIRDSLGLDIETTVEHAEVVAGETLKLHYAMVLAATDIEVQHLAVRVPALEKVTKPTAVPTDLKPGKVFTGDFEGVLSEKAVITQPYWLRADGAAGISTVDNPKLIGLPENPPVVVVEHVFGIGGQEFVFRDDPKEVTQDDQGEHQRRIDVIPPVSLAFGSEIFVIAPGKTKQVTVEVSAQRNAINGAVRVSAPDGWKVSPTTQKFPLVRDGEKASFTFAVTAPANASAGRLTAFVDLDGKSYSNQRQEIRYAHLPLQLLQPPARARVATFDLAIKDTQVGYLPGAGDYVAECLEQMGYTVRRLTGADLTAEKLKGLDAVVIGVRAFNERTDLAVNFPGLLAYVETGGTVIAQYNRPNGLNAEQLGPYSLSIQGPAPQLRVTDEKSPFQFLTPDHAALNTPNKITPADFEGWVQERGAYFPSKWDEAHYETVLAFNDPGEAPLTSSVLIAKHGQGRYVYTSLAFFRQLPAGVPGAYRLFANLVSLGK
ncbi:PIG-L family deacetylase [Oleiharenicola lentus]|uniref:PIG-L family deacetylase n=1 Tax=Oleiharenicola lentus TaxID=2508720 RepID=UPI003F661659